MNVTVGSREFVKELELLAKVASTKPANPVMSNVLMQADEKGMRLAASDLEIGVVTFTPCVVEESGATTLPAKRLLEIVKRLPDRDITLTEEKGSVRITSGRYTGRLPTYPATEYPTIPTMKGLDRVTLPAGFQHMLRQVRFAVSDKGAKYFMNGALLAGGALVATDGHRMSVSRNNDLGIEEQVLIPAKALEKLEEMYAPDALFAASDRHLFFVMDGRLLFARVVEGKFPSWENIIPKGNTHSATLNRPALRDALDRVVVTSEELVLSFTPNLLTVSGKSAELGDAAEQVDAEFEGEPSTIYLKGGYVLDFLNVIDDPDVRMEWKVPGSVLFTAGEHYSYVQMPMGK